MGALLAQSLGKGVHSGVHAVAGYLGLPNIGKDSKGWRATEAMLGKSMEKVAKQCCSTNLEGEIKATLDAGIQARVSDGRVPLAVSTDMGWQKKGSGRSYNSNSGHNCALGCRTQKVLDYVVLAKLCSTCETAKRMTTPPRFHDCVANYSGSSKAMEPISTCDLAVRLFEKKTDDGAGKCFINWHLTDDDSTTRANMKTVGKLKKDKGKLPIGVTPPAVSFTDPTHRTRIFGKDMFALVGKPGLGFKNGHAERLKKFHGYAVKQYRHEPLPSFVFRMKAVVEHMFDNHMFCDTSWCKEQRKRKAEMRARLAVVEQVGEDELLTATIASEENWKFWSKVDDRDLYIEMQRIQDKHTSKPMLHQLMHPFTSQKNEALNAAIAKVAPKDLTFSKTPSLRYRIAAVVGIDSVGWLPFVKRVLLDVNENYDMPESMERFFVSKQKKKEWAKGHQGKREVKQKRREKTNAKILQQKLDDQRAQQAGTYYAAGIAVSVAPLRTFLAGMTCQPTGNEAGAGGPTCASCHQTGHSRSTFAGCRNNMKNKICGSCGKKGHSRTTHQDCDNNKKRKNSGP
jgi:hypothetical protein